MLKNATYDLMETAAVLSKGLQLARVVQHLKEHFAHEGELKLAS